MTNPSDELRTIADTIETNGGWRIAAVKVRAAADELEQLNDRLATQKGVIANHLEEIEQYKAWWERDSKNLGTALNELSLVRAIREDQRAEIERLRSGIQKYVSECGQCEGRGQAMSGGELIDCDQCSDLRALLSSADQPTSAEPGKQP